MSLLTRFLLSFFAIFFKILTSVAAFPEGCKTKRLNCGFFAASFGFFYIREYFENKAF